MTTIAITPSSQNKILSFVIALALLVHIWAIYLLHGMPMGFPSSRSAMMERHLPSQETPEIMEKEEILRRNQQLTQVFQEIITPPDQIFSGLTYDTKNNPQIIPQDSFRTQDLSVDLSALGDKELSHDLAMDKDLSSIKIEEWNPSQNVTEMESQFHPSNNVLTANNDLLAKELIRMAEQQQGEVAMEPVTDLVLEHNIKAGGSDEGLLSDAVHNNTGNMLSDSLHGDAGLLAMGDVGLFKEGGNSSTHEHQQGASNLSSLPALLMRDGLHSGTRIKPKTQDSNKSPSVASSDDFILRVEYAPKQNASGYLFRLQLIPKDNAVFKRIKHNVSFLIDRSHSIPSERYERSKRAVVQALYLLQEGDSFNVLVFDSNVVRMSAENLPFNPQNITKAHEFLSQQSYGGLFATTDLYSSLGDIVPAAVADQEVNTAILLSDGDPILGLEKQRTAIGRWTRQNAGKVSLYSVAAAQGNNLSLLDLLSSVNKGELHYSHTEDGLANTIHNLIQGIQNPIGKEITTTVVVPNNQLQVALFPIAHRLPNLYQDVPYVIYGSINKLEDFHVFFQGKYYDRWLDIKQTVSFSSAERAANANLERLWTLQQAYDCYDQFLFTGDTASLVRARRLLTSCKIPIPF